MHDIHSGGLSLWKWYNVSQLPNVTSLVYQPVDTFEDFTIRFFQAYTCHKQCGRKKLLTLSKK